MNPVTHPLVKTAQDARRSINRLEAFAKSNPEVETAVAPLIEALKELRRNIPAEYRDADINN